MLKKLNANLNGRALIYAFGNVALGASNFIAAAIFVRLMSPADYGLSCVYITWVALIAKIIGLRIESTVQNARLQYGDRQLRGYCSSVIFLDMLIVFVIMVLSIICIEPISALVGMEQNLWILAIVTAFFLVCSDLRKSYCSAIKNAPGDLLVSCLLAFGQIICSIVFVLMLLFSSSYHARVWGYSIPTVLVGLGICIFFFMKGRTFVNLSYWKFCLTFSVPMIFNGIANLLINQSDRLMLNAMVGADMAGIYSFVYSIALPITVVTNALGSAWQPEYYEIKAAHKTDLLHQHARRYTTNVLLISLILMCVSPEILKLFGTQDYYAGIDIIPLVISAYFFQFLYTWPLNCELYNRKTAGISISTVIAAGCNIGLNALLIPQYAMMGAAVATLVSFVLLFVLHSIFAALATDNYSLRFRWFIPYIAGMLVATAVMCVLSELWVLRWLAGLVLGCLLLYRMKKDRTIM